MRIDSRALSLNSTSSTTAPTVAPNANPNSKPALTLPPSVLGGSIADWDDPSDAAGVDLCWEAYDVITSCLGMAATSNDRDSEGGESEQRRC